VRKNPCKVCGSTYHTAYKCPQNPKAVTKALATQKRLRTAKKPKTAKKKKTKTRSQLVKELDAVFSLFIRLRDDGKGCVTCGEKKPYKEMQNCHFYSRGRYPTRWDETNCHSGCYRCNVLLKGNYISYTKYMIDTYGREYVDELEFKSLNGDKIQTPVIREKIEYYREKVQKMLDLA